MRSVPSNQQNGHAAPQSSRDGRSADKEKEHLKMTKNCLLPKSRSWTASTTSHGPTSPMSTGGIALLLSVQQHKFDGILTIGKVVYIFDLVVFVTLVALITTRFIRQPRKLWVSLTHPSEGLMFPTFWLCIPTIVGGMVQYGVPVTGLWLVTVTEVIFWYMLPRLLWSLFCNTTCSLANANSRYNR